MTPTETVEEYYEALRVGDPLPPYFAECEDRRFVQMDVIAPREH